MGLEVKRQSKWNTKVEGGSLRALGKQLGTAGPHEAKSTIRRLFDDMRDGLEDDARMEIIAGLASGAQDDSLAKPHPQDLVDQRSDIIAKYMAGGNGMSYNDAKKAAYEETKHLE